MKSLLATLMFLLVITVLCLNQAEAVQPRSPQLVYPSSKRIVIFVADG